MISTFDCDLFLYVDAKDPDDDEFGDDEDNDDTSYDDDEDDDDDDQCDCCGRQGRCGCDEAYERWSEARGWRN